MKVYTKIKSIISLSLVILLTFACTDGFDELNTEKNLVTGDVVDVDLMLAYIMAKAIKEDSPVGTGTIGNYSGMSRSGSNLPFGEGQATEVWNNTYKRATNNLSEIIYLTQDDPALVNKTAIARILKVWAFAKLTDTYGDVPYFESSRPKIETIFDPVYDTQQSIYLDFFKELKEAATDLDAAKVSYGDKDFVYNGDVEKWRKFANSLRFRLALRVRYVDEQLARDNMSDLTEADLILSSNDDAIMFTSTDIQENNNRLYLGVVNWGTELIKSEMAQETTNIMINNNDPRIKIWADTAKAAFTDDNGVPFGYRGVPLLGNVPIEYKYPWSAESSSRISDLWYVPIIEVPVLRSSEMYFALAEARLFGLISSGAADDYYKKGMAEAMDWAKRFYENAAPQLPGVLEQLYDWPDSLVTSLISEKELTQAEIDTFLASSAADLVGSNEQQLEQIINQKNIALYPLEYQNWAEWRRTGYPIVQTGPDTDVLQGVSPRRMGWPDSEQTLNSVNNKDAVDRIGGVHTRKAKVWWDANPNVPYDYTGPPLPTRDVPWF